MEYIIILVLGIIAVYNYLCHKNLKKELRTLNLKLNSKVTEKDYTEILMTTENKEIQNLLLNINEIIKSKREEKLIREERDKRIREMLSNISHDLKTPLTVILGYIEMLNLNKVDNEERASLLEDLMDKIKGVVKLINNFFSLAKLENGDKDLSFEYINLSEVLRESVISFGEILDEKGFEVNINLEEKDVVIYGNKEAFSRIINNLISNAIRYGYHGKFLGIDLIKEDKKAIIQVRDKGQGILKKDIDRIFERSFTGNSARNSEDVGNGLGLAIVKKLLETLGGTISVYSEPYKETVFTVEILTYIHKK